ncbi:MAG: MFS transporter [Oscillospiraceae bacterium]|nr:MFS transporter [Oscillospiraceae bacterium]
MSTKTQEKDISLISANFGVKGWIILILTFLCIFLDSSLINDSLNVVVDVFAGKNQWDTNMLYGFSTITAWIAVVGAALWGVLSNKISLRWSWALSLLITGVACLFWGRASSPIVYFVCLAVASVGGMGFCYICSLNVISNWFPRKKGMAMGWVTIGFPLSAAVTANALGGIVAKGGLEQVYTIYAVVSFVLCILVAILVRDYPEQAGAFPDNNHKFDNEEAKKELALGLEYMKSSVWKPGKLLSTGKVWMIGIALGVMELLSLGIMTNFVPRMMQAGYVAVGADGVVNPDPIIFAMLGIAGILACLGSVGCGIMDAKLGPKKAIQITMVVAIIAIVLNLIPTTPTKFASLPFLAIMLGGAANYLVSLTNTIWGRYDFPMAYKVLKPMVAAVGALGVSVVGIIGRSVSYAVSYGVLAVLTVIALILISNVDDSMIGRN